MSQWQPMFSAPKDGTIVLLLYSDFSGVQAGFWGSPVDPEPDDAEDRWFFADCSDEIGASERFAAWLELPPAPWRKS